MQHRRSLAFSMVGFIAALALGCARESSPDEGERDLDLTATSDDSEALAPGRGGGRARPPAASADAGLRFTPIAKTGPALPPQVCKVLQDNGCITCHQGHGHGGAPFGLQLRDDFLQQATDESPLPQAVLSRIQDSDQPMPPLGTGRPLPPPADVALLRAWFEAGLPGVDGGPCAEGAALNTSPEWARAPWPGDQCEYVMTIGAHARSGTPSADDPTGFPVPLDRTYYHCFYEKVPWGDRPAQALAIRAVVEEPADQELVHHLTLSALGPDSGISILGGRRPTKAGEHHFCANPSGSMIGAWAPGATNPVTLPSDTGMLLPSGPDAFLEMQVHYNNPWHRLGRFSRTKFEICATTKLRPNTAAVHTLGFENSLAVGIAALNGTEPPKLTNRGPGLGSGACTARQRARILAIGPHMHALGRHARVDIVRGNGTVQVVHDKPYDFREQVSYMYDNLWVEAGEKIRSTCRWNPFLRPIVFGHKSQDEMCFMFVLATPAGSLAGVGMQRGFVGGDLSCAGAAR